LAVSREWSAAVRSLRPSGTRVFAPRDKKLVVSAALLAKIDASPLAPHVAQLGQPDQLLHCGTPLLGLLSRCTNIRAVHVIFILPQKASVVPDVEFPPHTRVLEVGSVLHGPCAAFLRQSAVAAAAQLAELEEFVLHTFTSLLRLDALQHCRSLRRLSLRLHSDLPSVAYRMGRSTSNWSADVANQLRTVLPHLEHLDVGSEFHDRWSAQLLAPTGSNVAPLQWKSLGPLGLTAKQAPLLANLPSLTSLSTHISWRASFDVLAQLPSLRCLSVDAKTLPSPLWRSLVQQFVRGHLRELDEFCLRGGKVESAELSEMLCHVPHLRTLLLADLSELASFKCLSHSPSICRSLECLSLSGSSEWIWKTELSRLAVMRGLHTLRINPRVMRLDGPTRIAYERVPCQPLPSLRHFAYSADV
jgi:hypothetical protein